MATHTAYLVILPVLDQLAMRLLQNATKGSLPGATAGTGMGGFNSSDNPAAEGMQPVQRDCWQMFNTPEAHSKENGVTLDEVRRCA